MDVCAKTKNDVSKRTNRRVEFVKNQLWDQKLLRDGSTCSVGWLRGQAFRGRWISYGCDPGQDRRRGLELAIIRVAKANGSIEVDEEHHARGAMSFDV